MPDEKPSLIQLQIIHAALVMGVLTFGVVCLLIRPPQPFGPPQPTTWMALGMAAAVSAARLVVPRMIVQAGLRKAAEAPEEELDESLTAAYVSAGIVGGAMLEGAAFLLLVMYWVESDPVCLIGAGLLVLAMIASFPTPFRFLGWLEEQRRLAREQSFSRRP